MAPTAAVLLPRALSDRDRHFVNTLIGIETRTLGRNDESRLDCFDWSFGFDQHNHEPEHPALIEREFGFMPVDEIALGAITKHRDSQRLLGEFCVILAERFEGIVDFQGVLWPPIHDQISSPWDVHDWNEVGPDVRNFLADLPGRLVALPCQIGNGCTWACHFGDATFMRAWLQHPHFYLD